MRHACYELGEVIVEFGDESVEAVGPVECDVKDTRPSRRNCSDLRPRQLGIIANREVTLAELPSVFGSYLQGTITGRTLVRIGQP